MNLPITIPPYPHADMPSRAAPTSSTLRREQGTRCYRSTGLPYWPKLEAGSPCSSAFQGSTAGWREVEKGSTGTYIWMSWSEARVGIPGVFLQNLPFNLCYAACSI